jgi:uncharacterized protein involved in exopolysaccharide biosynthesis
MSNDAYGTATLILFFGFFGGISVLGLAIALRDRYRRSRRSK